MCLESNLAQKSIAWKSPKNDFFYFFEFLKVCTNFEMAVTPSLWLLSNQTFYQNVFRIEFGTKKDIIKKSKVIFSILFEFVKV
jgi:hypothetical protein